MSVVATASRFCDRPVVLCSVLILLENKSATDSSSGIAASFISFIANVDLFLLLTSGQKHKNLYLRTNYL